MFQRVYSQGCVYSVCVPVFGGLEADRIVCPCKERGGAQVCSQSRGVGVRITPWNTREINYKKCIGSCTQDPRPRKRTKAQIQRFIPCSNSDSALIHTLNLDIFYIEAPYFLCSSPQKPEEGGGTQEDSGLN